MKKSVLGFICIIMYVFAWFVPEQSGLISLVKMGAFALSAASYVYCVVKCNNTGYARQLVSVNLALLIFHILLVAATFHYVLSARWYSEIFMETVWVAVPLAVLIYGIRKSRAVYAGIRDSILQNKQLLAGTAIIAAIVVVCAYDTDGPHFVWDSNLAYNHILCDIQLKSFFEVKDMIFCDHIAFSYFYPVSLLSFLLGNIDLAFIIFNNLCSIVAAFGFALLFHRLFPQKKTYVVLAAVAMCTFSPYVFGMASSCMYDYAALCITPLLLYSAYSRKWILFTFTGTYACFIKEPSILFFAAICLSVLLWEIISEKKSLAYVIKSAKYWYMILIGAIFAAVFLSIGQYGYSGSSEGEAFGYDPNHAAGLIKLFCTLNYSWVLVILSVLCIVFVLIKGKAEKEIKRGVLITAVPGAVFLIANAFILAPLNPRYIDYFYPCILILSVIFIMQLGIGDGVRCAILAGIGVLFVTASYFCIDPVSDVLFYKVNVGETSVYSTMRSDYFCDPAVYNRQYYGFDLVMNDVLGKAMQEKDNVLAISTGSETGNWQMSGKWTFDQVNEVYEFDEFWDNEKNMRSPGFVWDYYSDPRFQVMNIRYIFPVQDPVKELSDAGTFIYIYMPTINEKREDAVREAFSVIEEGSYTRKGWTVAYIRGESK